MLKILILIALSFNLAFAKSRFTDADKKKFMEEVKQSIAAHKLENGGKVDLQIIKPGLYEELDIYYKQEKFTREEMVKIKQRYEEFSKNSSITATNAEEEFYKFVQSQLDEINKTQVEKIKEGQACNNWSCEEGLKCAPDPKQEDGSSCKKEGRECTEDKDCCSSSCTLNKKSNKRFCEEVYRCFRPLGLGQSCTSNPVCGEGDCLAFNSKTSGIGECEEKGKSCKKNSDCCSNSCDGNKCTEAYICKDCVKTGKKPDRGQKCCEGLYLNDSGMCVPDVPPIVFPQVRNNPFIKIFKIFSDMIIPSASAQVAEPVRTCAPLGSSQLRDVTTRERVYNEDSGHSSMQNVTRTVTDPCCTGSIASSDHMCKAPADSSAYDIVNANHDKYKDFRVEATVPTAVQVRTPELKFTRKSDFTTCDIRFRDDFANYLKASGLINLELALLSFDYMLSGDGVNDYWTKTSQPSTSIYARLKDLAIKHQKIRTQTNLKLEKINEKLTCMCLDSVGYGNIKDEAKKAIFEKCPEFQATQTGSVCFKRIACSPEVANTSTCVDGTMPQSCASGTEGCTCTDNAISSISDETASGIKGKKLLVNWTKNLEAFNIALAIDNTSIYRGFADITKWSTENAKWNEVEHKKYTLFNFHMKEPSGSVAAMGAILGALLAAGVIAVLGGFATTSILTAWAAAGIIATSAVTGGTGLWLIASLKGAWISKRPEIFDKYISTYGCGKKESCQEYSRELNQPYNSVCKVHTSANACVKNFVVYYEDTEPRYVVDPWIPKDVPKSLILRDADDAKDYAHKLEDGFQAAKSHMIAKNPAAVGGGEKGGVYVAEDYMRTLFVDSDVLAKYTPVIGMDDQRYLLTDEIIAKIKSEAIKYAKDQKFFEEGDTENLVAFADYAYQFHFLWPKTSRQKEISYPTVGLTTYLELMSNGVSAHLAAGATNAAKTFGNLNAQYLEDYLKSLQLYADQPINQSDATRLALLNAEIEHTKADLGNQIAFNALSNNANLDSQLSDMHSGANTIAGGNVNLTSDQAGFLNAVGTLRSARKAQLKKLDTYTKAIAKNGNPDRAEKIASASKSFAAKFTNPLASSSSKGTAGIFGSGGTDGLGLKSEADGKHKPDSGYKNNDYGNVGAAASYSGSRSSGSGKPASASADTAGNGVSDEDSRRLAEAIEARNKANQSKYQSNDEQTIFEKVTNAYIRNYDKVLSKKKDKDIIEQK